MFKRLALLSIILVLFYAAFVNLQVYFFPKRFSAQITKVPGIEPPHTVYRFSFSKYLTSGEKEIEIEGDSANILGHEVRLMNVIAKAYAEETPIVITADRGAFDKQKSIVHLDDNVVATTETGSRLITEELDIITEIKRMESPVLTNVKTENIDVVGTEAVADSKLNNVKFKKNVTVSFRDPNNPTAKPTVITCDGILDFDYAKHVARFYDNVVAVDSRGTLKADRMDVIYDKETEKLDRMIGIGNVEVIKPDGSSTLSESVIYYATEGRVVLGGDPEVIGYEDEEGDQTFPFEGIESSELVDFGKSGAGGMNGRGSETVVESTEEEKESKLPTLVTKGIF